MKRVLIVFVATALMLSACGTPIKPCGTFTFNGAPDSPNDSGGITLSDSFAFSPSSCGSRCAAKTIAYIQVVRIIDLDTGEYLAPSSQQQARIVTGQSTAALNGWSVDRLDNHIWGYYGRNNDGTFDSNLTPGSNTTPAVLLDAPDGWPDSSWFDAVDVPVCIDNDSACSNNLLGFYYWLYLVGTGGSASAPFSEIGVDWHQTAVNLAVAKWNSVAPGAGKNVFPAFSHL